MAQGRSVRVGEHDLHFRTMKDLKAFIEEELERLATIEREIDDDSAYDGKLWVMIANQAELLNVLLAGHEDWIRSDTHEIDEKIAKVREGIREIGGLDL